MTAGFALQPADAQLRGQEMSPSHNGSFPAGVVIATINRLQGHTGVHAHTAALCEGLRSEGVRCDIVTPFDNASHWLALFSMRPLLLNRFWPSQSIHWYRHWHGAALRASLRRFLSAHEVSHIIAQCPISAQAAMDVRSELGQTSSLKIALVCHFNQSEAHEYRDLGQLRTDKAYQRMLAFEAEVLRRVDQVVYVSEWIRDVVERDRRITPRNSAVVHNGIEPQAESKAALCRAEISGTPADLLLINVGTLERRKNQLGLLELFAVLHARQPMVKLLLVGDGPDRAAIQRRVRALGLSDRVILLGRRTDVTQLLNLADLYVHYSSAENCPIAILESARAALPWAAIPAAGIPELQTLIGGCIALDPGELTRSADAMLALLTDPARLKHLGGIARDHFLARFTCRTMVRTYVRLLALPRCATAPAEVPA